MTLSRLKLLSIRVTAPFVVRMFHCEIGAISVLGKEMQMGANCTSISEKHFTDGPCTFSDLGHSLYPNPSLTFFLRLALLSLASTSSSWPGHPLIRRFMPTYPGFLARPRQTHNRSHPHPLRHYGKLRWP